MLPRFGIFTQIIVTMGKNTSISLGNHFEDFIREEVNSGRYGSVSEVIRSALRLLEREEKKHNNGYNSLLLTYSVGDYFLHLN
jgi:putative addiction module CopG family antidote